MRKVITVLFMVTTVGCASMNTPSYSLIESVPVIKVGVISDAPKDHIIFIPANYEFPIEFSVKGTVFSHDFSSKVMARFKQDMYIYRYWASLDGKNWVNSHKLMNVEPSGGFDKTGGKVEVKLDLVQ